MKKTLLLTASALCAWSFASAETTIEVTNVPQPANDTLTYAMPVNTEHFQDIQDYPENNPSSIVMRFQPEYLVTKADFSVGDTSKGTPTLPNNAKVVGLALDGYDVASEPDEHGLFLEVAAWCRNVGSDVLSHEHIKIFDGYKTYKPEGELLIDTVTYRNPWQGTPGYLTYFDMDADSLNPGTIVDVPFTNPDANPSIMGFDFEKNYPPFWYKGENIILTLWMSNFQYIKMKYRYMTYDNAEAEIASLFRTGNICFNNNTLDDVTNVLGMPLMYDLPTHSLPAFRLPYYTNDIRVIVNNSDDVKAAVVVLTDEDGNVIEPAEDGNYYNLDHEKTYTVTVDGDQSQDVNFDDIYKDIVIDVKKDRTAVEEVNAARTATSVRYYNVAGQQSVQPFEGMNIVVTTYNDGTTSTSKVIK